MSLVAFFVAATVSTGQPAVSPHLIEIDAERTPMRCKPAPYYVADRGGERRPGLVFVLGSRVPVTVRDVPERRPRPCMLMRDGDMPRGLEALRIAD